eukprot:scaffold30478_cov70-Phaeocystis_antarctica.AAC.1
MEEAPQSYKDVNEVVDTCHAAGISSKCVKLRPIARIKGCGNEENNTQLTTLVMGAKPYGTKHFRTKAFFFFKPVLTS